MANDERGIMDEGMTRKGFLAAAMAAGAAALVPSATAGAEETSDNAASQLSALGLEVEKDADLQGTSWAEAASQAETTAPVIDVVRSDNGIHSMNVPGYFMFSGWDKEHDQPTDNGFGMSGTGFLVRGEKINIWVNDVQINGSSLEDWITYRTVDGDWTVERYRSGKVVLTSKTVQSYTKSGAVDPINLSNSVSKDLPLGAVSQIEYVNVSIVNTECACVVGAATPESVTFRAWSWWGVFDSPYSADTYIRIEGR